MRTFRLGEIVQVKSGPHAGFDGKVEGINQSRSLLKVAREVLNSKPAEGLFVRESVPVKLSDAEKIELPSAGS